MHGIYNMHHDTLLRIITTIIWDNVRYIRTGYIYNMYHNTLLLRIITIFWDNARYNNMHHQLHSPPDYHHYYLG